MSKDIPRNMYSQLKNHNHIYKTIGWGEFRFKDNFLALSLGQITVAVTQNT